MARTLHPGAPAPLLVCFSVLAISALLSGCQSSLTPRAAALSAQGTAVTGRVYGGQQPISAATIQLYAVITTGTADGMASTPLLTATVTTSDGTGTMNANANAANGNNTLGAGYFNITNDFSCPTTSTPVFLTASAGNPGISQATNNTAIQQVLALGTCGSLAGQPFLTINEVTTVGAVAALYPYMRAYNAIGSTAAHASALTAAFNTAAEYINLNTGQSPGPALPTNMYADTNELNELGNATAACVNTARYVNGDGGACDKLFTDATPPAGQPGAGIKPSDIVTALLNIRNNPTSNVTLIYNLEAPSAPFTPTSAAAPSDWTLPIVVQPGTPTFSPASGSYAAAQTVTITDSDATAVIYYTTDGSTPTTSSTVYSTALTVSAPTTLQALAVDSGRAFSAVASATYTITTPVAATPTFSPAGGTYTATQTVLLSSGTAGASIYYTVDGTTPTAASPLYTTGGISVGATETVNAIAVASGYSNSAIAAATYTLNVPSGTITTLAGTGAFYFCCDGSAATDAELQYPTGVAVDASGNLYIADSSNNRIRKVDASTGIITTVAGTGTSTYNAAQDGGQATSANIAPYAVAVDASGNLYIADYSNNRIRKVSSSGIITTIAGTGTPAYSAAQDGGQATSANFNPIGVEVDASGNLYIADYSNNRIRKVILSTGIITTIAGTGTTTYNAAQDGGPATSANINTPRGVAVDASGNLFIADSSNNRIRKVVLSTGIITTIAGTGTGAYNAAQDGGQATSANIAGPQGVAVDASGNLFIADTSNQRIRKVVLSTGIITTIAGTGSGGYTAAQDGGPATSASINYPSGVAVDAGGNLFIADTNNQRIRKVTAATGIITTVAGNGGATYSPGEDGHIASAAQLYNPSGVTTDPSGNLYIADTNNNRIRKVTASTGIITTVAGNGASGYTAAQDGGQATSASLNAPTGVAVDASGNLYIADTTNQRIRKVAASTGIITTVAGNGTAGYTAAQDGGAATSASLNSPNGVAVDSSGNLFIADTTNSRIRKVTASTGIITTVAGTGVALFAGDNGLATSAKVNKPYGVAVDASGNLFIADTTNQRIRKVTVSTGIISTVAGSNSTGSFAGDNGLATSARLNLPDGVTVDASGNLYIADTTNQRIRKVTASTGIITTVAGNGTAGYTATQDGGTATSATLNLPHSVAVDASGNLYIADYSNNRIRKVTP